MTDKKKILKLSKDFDVVNKNIGDVFKLRDEISRSDIHNKDLEMFDAIEKRLGECINELSDAKLKFELSDKLKQTPLEGSCYSKKPCTYEMVNGGFFFKVNFVNVLNNWRKLIDSLKKHYNINDEDSTEEVQQFQIEAIKIKEGVVSDELLAVLTSRLEEIQRCIKNEICLGGVILIGSTLEGLLFGVAEKSLEKFKTANKAPNKGLEAWSLNDLINVANELGILKKDRKDLSHSLREYRNYVHPNREMKEDHHPDKHMLFTSYEVLKGIVHDLKAHAENVQRVLEDQ